MIEKIEGLPRAGIYRSIQLREHLPNTDYFFSPLKSNMEYVDSLEKKWYRFRTDDRGFILPNKNLINEQVSDSKDIYFLGGSTTECLFVDEESRWPFLVEEKLNKKNYTECNVYNAGAWGNTTQHSINILLNKLIQYKPFMCVMMHNINDLVLAIHERNYWEATAPSRRLFNYFRGPKKKLSFIEKITKIKAFFLEAINFKKDADEFENTRDEPTRMIFQETLEQFELNLKLFINICITAGITPVLMTQANRLKLKPDPIIEKHVSTMLRDKGLTYNDVYKMYSALNSKVRDVANNMNIELIDLDVLIPKDKQYIYDSVHFNSGGCELVAEKISERLAVFLEKPIISNV